MSVSFLSNTKQNIYIKTDKLKRQIFAFDKNRIELNKNRITYSFIKKDISFADTTNSICDKKMLDESILKIKLPSILDSIDSMNVEKLTDDSCTEEQKTRLGIYLSDMLTSERSWLTKCFNNKSVNKLIDADTTYQSYTSEVYAKYLRLIDQINNDKNPITISCKMSDKNKLGSFNEKTKPPTISFNLDVLSKRSLGESLSEATKQVLGHELFHYGEMTSNELTEKENACVNEKYAEQFTTVCSQATDKKDIENTLLVENEANRIEINKRKKDISTELKIRTSKEIQALCVGKSIDSKEFTKGSSLNREHNSHSGKSGIIPAQAAAAAQAQQQQAAVQTQLKQTVKASDFTQPSDSDFATLVSQTTPNTQDGKAYTVPANSDFGKVVQNTMNSFAKSGNTLTAKLNSAIAVTTPTAQATTPALAGQTNSPSTTTVAGKLALATPTAEPNPTTAIKTDTSTAAKNSRMPATEEPTVVLKKLPNNSGQTSELAGRKNAQPGSGANTSATTRTLTGPMQTTGDENSKPNLNTSTSSTARSNSSGSGINNSRIPASLPSSNRASQNAEGASLVKTIQSLKAFNSVSGNQYQEIKKYYTNPYFKNLLQTNDMRIVLKNENGQYVGIGVDSNQAKKVFNDDGQFLKAIEPKK